MEVYETDLLGATAIDDILNPWDGERRLGDVGRDDNKAVTLWWLSKDLHLLLAREQRV